jgi:hypothetical protein
MALGLALAAAFRRQPPPTSGGSPPIDPDTLFDDLGTGLNLVDDQGGGGPPGQTLLDDQDGGGPP